MVETLVQGHRIGLQHGVVIFNADGTVASFSASSGLTDTQLRATPVPVSTLAADAGLVALAANERKGADKLNAPAAITVNDTETAVAIARPTRRSLLISNTGSNPVKIGKTTATNFTLATGASCPFTWTGAFFGICGAGLTSTVEIVDEYD